MSIGSPVYRSRLAGLLRGELKLRESEPELAVLLSSALQAVSERDELKGLLERATGELQHARADAARAAKERDALKAFVEKLLDAGVWYHSAIEENFDYVGADGRRGADFEDWHAEAEKLVGRS